MKTSKLAKLIGFQVFMTEYERGWGSRPYGSMLFENAAKAEAYINEIYKDRTGPTPDYYVHYSMGGLVEITDIEAQLILTKGHAYRD